MDGQERTRIVTFASNVEAAPADDRIHSLLLVKGSSEKKRHLISTADTRIGRTPPADIVLADSEVSRVHCNVVLRDGYVIVTDMNSTNGTFIDGVKLSQPTVLPVGAVLQVGRQHFRHEWRSHSEIAQNDEMDRELERANSYVQALLPAPIAEGPIRANWFFQPCAKLGGDAFGYAHLSDRHFGMYLIDVAGHGAGAAMHSVTVMNLLRQRSLPNTDITDPAGVLAALNEMFQMEHHAELYFTIWYGIFDRQERRLSYASGGHHPAYMFAPGAEKPTALHARNSLIGAMPNRKYVAETVDVPHGASIYLFSDGVFEIQTRDGRQWGLDDFLPILAQPTPDGQTEADRIHMAVQEIARPGGFEDDFSIVVATFD